MSVFSPSGSGSSSVSIPQASNPVLVNLALFAAGTEYTYALPSGTKRFTLQLRGVSTLQLAYTPGESGTTYITIGAGSSYQETDLNLTSITLYVQSTQPNQVLEIIAWT